MKATIEIKILDNGYVNVIYSAGGPTVVAGYPTLALALDQIEKVSETPPDGDWQSIARERA